MILTGARQNDGVSISVIRDTVKYLAMAVSNIAAVIDPEVILLGGILQSSGDLLLEPIRQECARRMAPGIMERARIEISPLGPDAAPMGAAVAEFGSELRKRLPQRRKSRYFLRFRDSASVVKHQGRGYLGLTFA